MRSSSDKETYKRIDTDKVRLRKYRTRQSLRDICDSSTSNNSFDAPSTSTGITASNNSVFRIIEQDSDEDVPPNDCVENNISSEDNLVNILPTPLNGTHDMYINVLEMTNGNANGNVVAVRNDEYEHASSSNGANNCSAEENHASTSTNGRYSQRNCISYDEECSPTNSKTHRKLYYKDSYTQEPYLINEDFVSNSMCVSESDSDYEFDYRTPPPSKKRRSSVSVTDSGCGSGPCSSNGTYSRRSTRNHPACSNSFDHSSEDDYACVSFKKRVKKAKLNIRKHVGADSDSN